MEGEISGHILLLEKTNLKKNFEKTHQVTLVEYHNGSEFQLPHQQNGKNHAHPL